MQMDDGHLKRLTRADLDGKTELGEQARRRPDLVFHVGDRVKIKGGDFEIQSIGKKAMVLRGLPGTRLAKHKPRRRKT
jgi:hypothetical protein